MNKKGYLHLLAIPFFIFLICFVMFYYNDPRIHTWLGDSNLKVSESNYNEVFTLVNEISNNLGISQPDTYVYKGGTRAKLKWFTSEVNYIVVDKKDYDTLPKEELKAVIAHEVAHKDDNWFYRLAMFNFFLFVLIIIGIAIFSGAVFGVRLTVILIILLGLTTLFIMGYSGKVNEVKADIAALKQTDLVTMKHMLFKIHIASNNICGEFKESDLNESSDALWEKEKEQKKFCVWWREVIDTHPYFTHRILILEKADKLIKEGKEPVPVWNKAVLNENEIEVSTNY